MDATLQTLLDTLSTLDFEEYGHLALTSVTWAANDVAIHLAVHQRDQADQTWRLHCKAVRYSRILNNQVLDGLRIETQHPVLLPYTEPTTELYFSSCPSEPNAVVGQLVEAHHEIVGGWFDCLHFFRGSFLDMLEGGFGKLAEGPKPLIERYAKILGVAGANVSSPPPRPPVWWDGKRWINEVKPLYALIFGKSYVVSSAVSAERG